MTYVISDLHGDLQGFLEMIKRIRLKDTDVLYVLGNSVDFGEESIALLLDMSMRANVYPIAGAHDLLALRMLTGFEKMSESGSAPSEEFAAEMTEWVRNGGAPTLAGYRELDAEMREGVLDYLSEFSLYEEVRAGGKDYVLVHAGIGGFDPETPLEDYEPEDFFTPAGEGETFFSDRTLVVGHTPTGDKIRRDGNVIRINCGARDGGALACLCLDCGDEFYV